MLKTVRPRFHLLKYGTLVNEVQEASTRCNIGGTHVVTAKSIVFWDVALYSLLRRYRYFMNTCTSVSWAEDGKISDNFYQSVYGVTTQKEFTTFIFLIASTYKNSSTNNK